MSRGASPFHCPYCGDTDLFPATEGWECRSCLRAFSVTYHGLVRPASGPGSSRSAGRAAEAEA